MPVTRPEDINVYGMTIKDQLNQEIFDGTFMRPNVRKALLRIADEFHSYLDIEVKYEDVTIVGSSINFHWSASSDVDLHLVYDFSKFPCPDDKEFIREYLISKKKTFNDRHDIELFGMEVELYSEDVNDNTKSSAIFSVLNKAWIRKPTRKEVNTQKDKVRRLAFGYIKQIDKLDEMEANDPKKMELAMKIKDSLMKLRTKGLEEGGEFSWRNITYKTIRHKGYVDKLFRNITQAYDEDLSYPEEQ